MVQTVDQYMLCHCAVRELFLEQLRVIDSHPYENVGNDGRPLVGDTTAASLEYETIDYGSCPGAKAEGEWAGGVACSCRITVRVLKLFAIVSGPASIFFCEAHILRYV